MKNRIKKNEKERGKGEETEKKTKHTQLHKFTISIRFIFAKIVSGTCVCLCVWKWVYPVLFRCGAYIYLCGYTIHIIHTTPCFKPIFKLKNINIKEKLFFGSQNFVSNQNRTKREKSRKQKCKCTKWKNNLIFLYRVHKQHTQRTAHQQHTSLHIKLYE